MSGVCTSTMRLTPIGDPLTASEELHLGAKLEV